MSEDQSRPMGREVLFDAVITPHRSLSARGFAILMAAVGGVSFTAGLAFVAAGAWPVTGFFGLDVALIYWAFRLNYRAGRAIEQVRLTRDELLIRRIDPGGRIAEERLQPFWLRVELRGAAGTERLHLESHGRARTIGAVLSPRERTELAHALGAALARLRCVPEPVSGAKG